VLVAVPVGTRSMNWAWADVQAPHASVVAINIRAPQCRHVMLPKSFIFVIYLLSFVVRRAFFSCRKITHKKRN